MAWRWSIYEPVGQYLKPCPGAVSSHIVQWSTQMNKMVATRPFTTDGVHPWSQITDHMQTMLLLLQCPSTKSAINKLSARIHQYKMDQYWLPDSSLPPLRCTSTTPVSTLTRRCSHTILSQPCILLSSGSTSPSHMFQKVTDLATDNTLLNSKPLTTQGCHTIATIKLHAKIKSLHSALT